MIALDPSNQYSERWKNLALQRFSGFYYIKDNHGLLTYVSPEVTSLLGWTPEEVIEKWPLWTDTSSAVHTENGNHVPHQLRGLSVSHCSIPDIQGRLRRLELVDHPIETSTNESLHTEGFATEVFEETGALPGTGTRENRSRQIIDFSPIGIFQTDVEHKFTYVNDYWQVITQYPLKQTLGFPWWTPIHVDDKERIINLWNEEMKKNRECFVQCRVSRPGGETRWVELRFRYLFHEEGRVIFGTMEDITDLKLMKQKLEEYAHDLKRSNGDLESFAAIASHDLKEPLRKILTFGNRLTNSVSSKDEEQSLEYLKRIQHAGVRMQNFIEDLLQFSRITSKARPFASVDLRTLVSDVVSDLEVLIGKNEATVQIGTLPVVKADEFQIRQVFQNLISNAIKFHKSDEAPFIKVDSEKLSNGDCQIWVQDNGVGFDPTHLERIFKPFERLHGRTEFEGSGMGLAICKKIIDRHGGTLTAESEPNRGTRFIFTFPFKP